MEDKNEQLKDVQLENAINFLLFSYFGITLESNADDVLNAAIEKAYFDATIRAALVLEKEQPSKEKDRKKIKNYLKLYGIEIITNYINQFFGKNFKTVFNLKNPNEIFNKDFETLSNCDIEKTFNNYDDWHKNLCNALVDYYDKDYKEFTKLDNNKNYFTYGNAQKWVNMTMKNLYILSIIFNKITESNNNTFYENIIERSSDFHIPLDGYIFEAVKLKGITAWSKIENYDNYKTHQENVKNNIKTNSNSITNSIEQENSIWIAQAKINKNKDLKTTYKVIIKDDSF